MHRCGRQKLFLNKSKLKKSVLATALFSYLPLQFPATTYSLAAYVLPEFSNATYSIGDGENRISMTEHQIESEIGINVKGNLNDEILTRIRRVSTIFRDDNVDLGKSVDTIVVFPARLGTNYSGFAPTRHTFFISDNADDGKLIHEFSHCDKYTQSDSTQERWAAISPHAYRHDDFHLSYVREKFFPTHCHSCAENGLPGQYASFNADEGYAETFSLSYLSCERLQETFSEKNANKGLYQTRFTFLLDENTISKTRYDKIMDLLWREPVVAKSGGIIANGK